MDRSLPIEDARDRAPDRVSREGKNADFEKSVDTLHARIAELREQQPRIVSNPKLGTKDAYTSPVTESSPRIYEPVTPTRDREQQVQRRPKRTLGPAHEIGLNLRPEERNLLYDVGRFRVISTADLARHLYAGNVSQLGRDLQYLHQNNLVEIHDLNVRRDGRGGQVERFEAVTLTKSAKRLLEQSGEIPEAQRLYSGLVKRREAEHDCQIYGAFQKEIASMKLSGTRHVHVQLDFELKANFNRAVYLARKAEPEKDMSEVKQAVAEQLQLKMSHGKVVVPDARLEYELPDGLTGRVELEIVTAAYRHGHITAKAKAGFKVYMSQGDIGRLGAGVQDDHDLMSEIFDL